MSETLAETAWESGLPDREAIRARLDATRLAFHQLVESMTAEDWKRKSANPSWTCGQLAWHIAAGVTFNAGMVENAREGKGFNPPRFLADRLNGPMTRWGARKATSQSVLEDYDRGFDRLSDLLRVLRDGEWRIRAKNFGEVHTIEEMFATPPAHFEEHAPDIRAALAR